MGSSSCRDGTRTSGNGGGAARQVTWDEVAERGLVVVHGVAYDLVAWAKEHPGGEGVLRALAGRDATTDFNRVHTRDVLVDLPPSLAVGAVACGGGPSRLQPPPGAPAAAAGAAWAPASPPPGSGVMQVASAAAGRAEKTREHAPAAGAAPRAPPVSAMLCLDDVERAAESVLPPAAFAYFATGAGDEETTRANVAAWRRLHLVPRVLVDVADATTACSVLGASVRFPVFVSAAARGKLAHPEGEACIARACVAAGVPQMVPQLGGATIEEVAAAADGAAASLAAGGALISDRTPRWLQLYVYKDRSRMLELIRRAEALGYSALVLTVDAPTVGKRLRDIRARVAADGPGAALGTAPRAGSSLFEERLSWRDLAWFRGVTRLSLLLKGVQCAQDALLAREHGVDAIVVSNHGGRNLDGCRTTMRVLGEVTAALAATPPPTPPAPTPAVSQRRGQCGRPKRFEVLVDGGIRTGADVVKALALGATAVGMGRPAIYGLAAHGQAGVERVLELLRTETLTAMKLMGVARVSDLGRHCIESADVDALALPARL